MRAVSYAREFRYDGARQRYLNRALDPATLAPITDFGAAVWTDYDGDAPYGDYVVGGLNSAVDWRSYEPGIGEVGPWTDAGDANTQYHHADHLGTLRLRTASSGAADATRVFSAFGERLAGPGTPDRYGYVGAHGYQAHEEFPFLHLGARYYDPASGRFLQRDPIGIEDQTNVYVYVASSPLVFVDPEGMWAAPALRIGGRWIWKGGKWVWGKVGTPAVQWGKKKFDEAYDYISRFRYKVEVHPPHHNFPFLGPRRHIQCTIWFKGKKGSGINIRIPIHDK